MIVDLTPVPPPPGLPPAAELITQLLDTVDVRPLALDALTHVRSIEWSEGVGTAAIECATSPRLVLNPTFVQRRCRTPETLAALLLHELAHVTLAHTRLAPRLGPIANIAFDALINRLVAASLRTRGVDAAPYLRLFEEEYDATAAPWFLLRPPPGWPDAPVWDTSLGAPAELRVLHRRLWTVPHPDPQRDTLPDVSARELIEALRTTRPRWQPPATDSGDDADDGDGNGASSTAPGDRPARRGGCPAATPSHADAAADGSGDDAILSRLLGNHGCTDAEVEWLAPEMAERLAESPLARAMPERALLDRLEAASGCGTGDDALRVLTIAAQDGRRETLRALERVFSRALEQGAGRRSVVSGDVTVLSPLVDQDRRAWGRRRLATHFGVPAPVLHQRRVASPAPTPTRVAVYLDVSGSMWPVLPALHGVLRRLRRRADVRLWQWSDAVTEAGDTWWRDRAIRSSGGTDITCVLEHALAQARRVRRIVILTDGLLPDPSASLVAAVRAARVAMHLAVVGFDGLPAPEHRWGTTFTAVPARSDGR